MSKLAFLTAISVIAQDEPKKKSGGGGARKEWNPASGLTVRVWKDGSVFPSQDLVNFFDLAYKNQPTEDEIAAAKEAGTVIPMGFGFDVADSQEFSGIQVPQRLLIISPVARTEGKVDLFGSVTYNKIDNTPLCTVMNQGAATFGESFLVPKIEEIYGIKFGKPAVEAQEAVPEEKDADGKVTIKAKPAVEAQEGVEGPEYVDMVLLGQEGEGAAPWTLPIGKTIAFFPKRFTKGEKRGEMTIARRENPLMYIFYPKSLIEETEAPAPSN
jgi:hypothetical protein